MPSQAKQTAESKNLQTIALFRMTSAGEKHLGTFDSIEDAATYLYNNFSDGKPEMEAAFERGDFDSVCACGDFTARLED